MPPKKAEKAAAAAAAADPKKAGKKAGGGIANQENNKYSGMLVKQLKDELKARGLPVGGLKDALLERLLANDKDVEANGGVQISQVDVDRRMTFVVNEKNRRQTFTVDTKAKTGKPKSKQTAKNAKAVSIIPESVAEEEDSAAEELEETRVITAPSGDNEVMFKGFVPDDKAEKGDESDQDNGQEETETTVEIKSADKSLDEEGADESIGSEEVSSCEESLDETNEETVKKRPQPQRHTYRLEGPGGVDEIHADTIDELLEKMKMLVVNDAVKAAAAQSPPAGVNKNKVDGASPVTSSPDDEEGLLSDEDDEEQVLKF